MFSFGLIWFELCPITIRKWNRIETESGAGSVGFLLGLLGAAAAADYESFF